jgi:ATP-dependent Lhr-like helicase
LTAAHDFYAVFKTPSEYRVITGTKTIGTLPVDNPITYAPGSFMIFGGRRWVVQELSVADKAIMVRPAAGGKPPKFGGDYGGLADGIVSAMRDVYEQNDIPPYLDATAAGLLQEARAAFHRFNLTESSILEHGSAFILFPWVGTKSQLALTLVLKTTGLKAGMLGFAVECQDTNLEQVKTSLSLIAAAPAPDPVTLAQGDDLALDKFDGYLSDDTQRLNFARAALDTTSIPEICADLLERSAMVAGAAHSLSI